MNANTPWLIDGNPLVDQITQGIDDTIRVTLEIFDNDLRVKVHFFDQPVTAIEVGVIQVITAVS